MKSIPTGESSPKDSQSGAESFREKLDGLRNAVLEYLAYLEEKEAAASSGLPSPDAIEQPEALRIYWSCKAMSIPYIAGGLEDQPHILVKELLTCMSSEDEYHREKERLSELLRGKFEN
ncbi:MAG: hypothetical protein QF737_05120 [Dehalococcoidales bacterium]|nr:hypothetical protein [Dehalococcoidales bacterium]